MIEQYFTALPFLYPNQESYGSTKDQSMGSFHVKHENIVQNNKERRYNVTYCSLPLGHSYSWSWTLNFKVFHIYEASFLIS